MVHQPDTDSFTDAVVSCSLARCYAPFTFFTPQWHARDPFHLCRGSLVTERITLDDKFGRFAEHWSPKIVAELNGQQVKLVKFVGAFDWHSHADEDELFLVHRGQFRMEFRDRSVTLSAGDMLVVPRGVEHRPVADSEVEVILFEPASTLNTGDAVSARTKQVLDHL